jgi:hypothetical protein
MLGSFFWLDKFNMNQNLQFIFKNNNIGPWINIFLCVTWPSHWHADHAVNTPLPRVQPGLQYASQSRRSYVSRGRWVGFYNTGTWYWILTSASALLSCLARCSCSWRSWNKNEIVSSFFSKDRPCSHQSAGAGMERFVVKQLDSVEF